ncbi:FKBP-type peptidyl-prolyl cis-trans isomerase [Desulfosediminicola flagellatus]|uniref:FKBP-type peptidyl-prolyl cis-trans isomerase n=1 Tax=Desulfosediminicola flagellatus TaxID=2569541 RepID=UPI0010AD2791|nr:peptidylprolyl isomerase [Desulfosediminicola flagellatus]
MQQAKNGDKVKVHYTGSLEDGSIFDSSEGHEPLEFEIGSGQVIVGFDEALTGMTVGEKKTVKIPCAKAYGDIQNELVLQVPLAQVPADLNPEIGMHLEVGGAQGEVMRVTIIDINETVVTLDANPPLAGKDLTFALELVAIA